MIETSERQLSFKDYKGKLPAKVIPIEDINGLKDPLSLIPYILQNSNEIPEGAIYLTEDQNYLLATSENYCCDNPTQKLKLLVRFGRSSDLWNDSYHRTVQSVMSLAGGFNGFEQIWEIGKGAVKVIKSGKDGIIVCEIPITTLDGHTYIGPQTELHNIDWDTLRFDADQFSDPS